MTLSPLRCRSPWRRCGGSRAVGAVEGVIEAAPAGVGGVQREAAVGHRHDELRPGHLGDLGVDVLGADLEGGRLGKQVADLAQEGGFLGHVQRLAAALAPPGVDLRLQVVAAGQQFALRGVKSERMASSAAQNAAGAMPVPGSRSCSTKPCRMSSTEREPEMSMNSTGL
jgi:hypothetical protein